MDLTSPRLYPDMNEYIVNSFAQVIYDLYEDQGLPREDASQATQKIYEAVDLLDLREEVRARVIFHFRNPTCHMAQKLTWK